MILLLVSVWMRPSLGLHWPRTVIVVGRPARSRSNFSSKRVAELVAHKFVKEFAERRTIGKLGDRKASAIRDLRVVGVDLRPRLGADKAGNDEIFERLADQRNRFQGFEVEGA